MPIHEDEGGLSLQFRFIRDGAVADISDADTIEVWAKPPGGSWTLYDTEFTTDGEDGLIRHVFSADELDTPGTWYAQGYVEMADWSKWSDVQEVLVKQNKT